MVAATTLYDKLWNAHVVAQEPGHPAVVYVDLHLMHDGTYRRAFEALDERGLAVARPDACVAMTDHCVPTLRTGPMPLIVTGLAAACAKHRILCFGPDDPRQGIVHVVGPELGLTRPGRTVICADSHTTTHGALGALAFVVGTTQLLHALATQCVLQRRVRTMSVVIDGVPGRGVTAKDIVLELIRREGVAAGAGYAVEYSGRAVRAMSIDERLTLCNMSAELGARHALVAPDDTTFGYLHGRAFSPKDAAWDAAVARWRTLKSDDDAVFDHRVRLDAGGIEPMVTFGTTPAMAVPVTGRVPDPASLADPAQREAVRAALAYTGFTPGLAANRIPVDEVFIGSCTNSRIDDLRGAASILRGRRVAGSVRLLVVPGSQSVRREAEAEGLDRVFRDAGGQWGRPGCSLCVAMNDEPAGAGHTVASTSNRNFRDRQGPGARTLLMSPLTAAASALEGRVADPRPYLRA